MDVSRYSRWDGTQSIDPFTADDLLDAMSNDLIANNDLRSALERLMREIDQGKFGDGMQGLRQLMEQLRQRRQQMLQRNNLGDVVDDIARRLEDIVRTERAGIDRRLDEQAGGRRGQEQQPEDAAQSGEQADAQSAGERGDDSQASSRQRAPGQRGAQQPGAMAGQSQQGSSQEGGEQGESQADESPVDPSLRRMLENIARRKQQYLDQLPPDPAGQIKALQQYEFMDSEARQKFEDLLNMLRQQMLRQFSSQLQQAMQSMTPEDMQRLRDLVRDLNQMLEARAQGRDPKFDEFMQKYGDIFPGVNSLDELLQQLQEQRMQMESLMNSMPGEMRQSLRDMLRQLFQDDRLQVDMARLAMNLDRLFPRQRAGQRYNFSGDEPVNFSEAMRLMEQMQGLDTIEKQLREARDGDGLDQVDVDKVRDLLGPEAARAVEQLKEIGKLLEEAGYVRKNGNQYELTPRALRKIGQKALRDIFSQLTKDRIGRHEADRRGPAGERIDESKPYEFGDPFLLDLRETLMNAVQRQGPGSPVALAPSDFSVYRTELLTQAATVLMIDLSRSMLLRGCFAAAKKVAIALDSLIRMQFPRDSLYIVGFAERAHQMKAHELHEIDWSEYVYGTNLQHGLMLSRHLLAKHKGGNRQVIVVTDGEPTAHCEADGQAYFSYPPTYRTYAETLKEVMRCTKEGIVINTFMLERSFALAGFVNQMTRINKGRAFFAEPERLGEYVLVDYVKNKRKKVS